MNGLLSVGVRLKKTRVKSGQYQLASGAGQVQPEAREVQSPLFVPLSPFCFFIRSVFSELHSQIAFHLLLFMALLLLYIFSMFCFSLFSVAAFPTSLDTWGWGRCESCTTALCYRTKALPQPPTLHPATPLL